MEKRKFKLKKIYCIKLQVLEPLILYTSNDSTVSVVVWPRHKIGNKVELKTETGGVQGKTNKVDIKKPVKY